MLRFYNQLVNKSPILVQSLMTGTTCMVGDAIAQKLTPYLIWKYNQNKSENKATAPYKSAPYDISRTLKFGLIGLLYFGPCVSLWLRTLDKIVPAAAASSSSKTPVLKKLLIDQFMFSPILTGGFLYINGQVVLNNSLQTSLNNVKENLLPIMLKGCPFWATVQFFNLSLVPLNFRALTIQGAAIVWNSFLSWYANSQRKKVE